MQRLSTSYVCAVPAAAFALIPLSLDAQLPGDQLELVAFLSSPMAVRNASDGSGRFGSGDVSSWPNSVP